MDPLDDMVRQAMSALERAAPHGYFDELPARIDERLEASMQFEQDHGGTHDSSTPPPGTSSPTGPNEDSGLHDIKALAQTAKHRISRRQTSQHDVDEALLSASSSGLHAVALPDPAKSSQTSLEQVRELARSSPSLPVVTGPVSAPAREVAHEAKAKPARAVAADRDPSRPQTKKGVPVWLWAGGGVAVAGAIAAVAFMMANQDDGAGEGKAARSKAASADRAVAEPAGQEERAVAAAPAPAPEPEVEALPPPPSVTALPAEEPAPADDPGAATDSIAAGSAAEADKADAQSFRRDRDDERDLRREKAEKKASGGGDAAAKGDGGKAQEKAAPPPDTKAKEAADPQKEIKKDPKKVDGAVLGEGDSDELGIGDALRGRDKKDDGPKKTELTSKEMRAGLTKINGKAKGCYDKYGVAGTAKVKLTIDPSGKVTKASATGEFAGTPTGDCVVSAVKSADFPTWSGAPVSTTHVVLLGD